MNYNWNWSVYFDEVAAGSGQYWEWLLSGLGWTLATALVAWAIALALGVIIGVIRTAPMIWAARLGGAYVELFRNIPLIVQMFLWYFVFPDLLSTDFARWIKQDLPFPEFTTAAISLGFYTSARVAEQVRAGISALPQGQRQAALAMGLTLPQTYRYILLPLASRMMLPPLTSEFMNVFKNSSVALTIGLLELTAQARAMNEYTASGFETFTAATVLYVIVALMVNRGMTWVERRARIPGQISMSLSH